MQAHVLDGEQGERFCQHGVGAVCIQIEEGLAEVGAQRGEGATTPRWGLYNRRVRSGVPAPQHVDGATDRHAVPGLVEQPADGLDIALGVQALAVVVAVRFRVVVAPLPCANRRRGHARALDNSRDVVQRSI